MIETLLFLTAPDIRVFMATSAECYAAGSQQYVWRDHVLSAMGLMVRDMGLHGGNKMMPNSPQSRPLSIPANYSNVLPLHLLTTLLCPRLAIYPHANFEHAGDRIPTIRYTCEIGVGDRSVRTSHPWPTPFKDEVDSNGAKGGLMALLKTAFTRMILGWKSGKNSSATCDIVQPKKPWVQPTVVDDVFGRRTAVLTPNYVSYFEITIETNAAVSTASSAGDCIAIGLSTSKFSYTSKLPGWDGQSYGYHSDDGGLFHCSGDSVMKWEKYGVGDTVGCGVVYDTSFGGSYRIFFTKNGILRWGFQDRFSDRTRPHEGIASSAGFYPTIGIDSSSPVSVNFGNAKPWTFDMGVLMSVLPSADKQIRRFKGQRRRGDTM
jgi:hypothetical protein